MVLKLGKEERGVRLEAGNAANLKWPVSASYIISNGLIYSNSDKTRTTFPLAKPEVYISFSRLGYRGQPSKDSVCAWVHKHGLLRREGEPPSPEEPERWLEAAPAEDKVVQKSISLKEFREEVRTFNQLLNLWSDIRQRDARAVISRFDAPPPLWPDTPPTWPDRFLARFRNLPYDYGRRLEMVGADVEATYLQLGLDIVCRTIDAKLDSIHPSLGWNWLDAPEPSSTDVGLVRWYSVPDPLSAMYLQLYTLITGYLPTRRCKYEKCRQPFPLTRKDRQFCNDTCRSSARHQSDTS